MTPTTDEGRGTGTGPLAEPGGERKAMTLRLPGDLHERLAALAEVEGEPIAEVVRRAVADHVERRRQDPDFQAKLDATLRQHRRLLSLLGDDSGPDDAAPHR